MLLKDIKVHHACYFKNIFEEFFSMGLVGLGTISKIILITTNISFLHSL